MLDYFQYVNASLKKNRLKAKSCKSSPPVLGFPIYDLEIIICSVIWTSILLLLYHCNYYYSYYSWCIYLGPGHSPTKKRVP